MAAPFVYPPRIAPGADYWEVSYWREESLKRRTSWTKPVTPEARRDDERAWKKFGHHA